MHSHNGSNVLAFVPKGRSAASGQPVPVVRPDAADTAVRILDLPARKAVPVFVDRIPPYDFQAFNFFRTLDPAYPVTVHVPAGDDVRTSVISVTEPSGQTFFVPFSDFVRYAHSDGEVNGGSEAECFLLDALEAFHVDFTECDELRMPSKTVVSPENLREFFPESIPLMGPYGDIDQAYLFSQKPENCMEMAFSPEEFVHPERVALLHALACIEADFTYNGYEIPLEDYLVLSRSASGDSVAVPFGLVRPAISQAVGRSYREYAGIADESERISRFYEECVVPELPE